MIPLGPFGTLHGRIPLPALAPLGDYQIRCQAPNGPVFTGRFRVEQYERQRVELERIQHAGDRQRRRQSAQGNHREPGAAGRSGDRGGVGREAGGLVADDLNIQVLRGEGSGQDDGGERGWFTSDATVGSARRPRR